MGYDASVVEDHSHIPGSCFIYADGNGYYTPGGKTASLTTDSIDMTALTTPELSFFLSSYNPTRPANSNTIYIDFYDGSTWHDSIYGHSGHLNDHWNYVSIPLSSYTITGKTLIRFNVKSALTLGLYNDFGLDDIRVTNATTCFRPTAVTGSSSNASSVTMSWTSGGATAWEVEYGPVGHQLGTGTVATANTNTNFVLSGLSAGSIYEIFVRDYCSSTNQSIWSEPIIDTTTCTSLSGTYTINQTAAGSATNFTSFSELANSLAICGVSGPVTVNVAPGSGVYNEQVEFFRIPGASTTNTVTINGNGEMLVDSGNVGTNYAAVLLNGTRHLIIDSLYIENTGTSNASAIQFMAADSNVVRNSIIKVADAGTTTSIYGITFSASATSLTTSGNNGNYNLIEGNEIIGGYFAVRVYGSTTVDIAGNQVVNNLVRDFRANGIYFYYTQAGVIRGNELHRLNRADASTTSTYCIQVGNSTGGTEVSYNWVHDMFAQASSSTSVCYPFYMNGSDHTAGNEGLLFNNVVSNIGGNGTHNLIYNSSSDYWKIYHNTLIEENLTPSTASSSYGTRMLYATSASNIEFNNNLLYLNRNVPGACYLLYINSNVSNVTTDNNAYYLDPNMPNGSFGQLGTANALDLATWQTNNSTFDQNSAEGNPLFVDAANNDFTPAAAYFNNIGANLQSLVADDYTGAPRTTTPDPGAFEFTPPPGPDMNVLNVYPTGASCGATTSVIVEFLNQGTDTVTSFMLNYRIDNVAQTGIPVAGSWPSGMVDSVIISGIPINATNLTHVSVTIASVAPTADIDASNNIGSIDWRQGYVGSYTLNNSLPASNTNFISFESLANSLATYGVCGDVIVNVTTTNTTYPERLALDEIPGASATATITINGNGNTLQHLSTSSSERATVSLNGTDWLTIDSLNIVALGSTTSQYGFGVALSNNADHNTIRNCNVQVANDLSSTNYAGITITGSLAGYNTTGQSGNYNTIEGNTIIGGYYGLSCYGHSSDSTNGNVIRNNTIQDFYIYGAYINYHRDVVFSGNDINREGTSRTTFTTTYGMRLQNGKSSTISANKVHDLFLPTTTSQGYYMHLSYLEGTASNPVLVSNNLIYNTQSDGTYYGAYFAELNNTIIVHNTIALNDQAYSGTSGSAFGRPLHFQDGMSDVNFSNNLVYYDLNVPAIATYMIYANSVPTVMDHNVYYTGTYAPANFALLIGRTISDLQNWKTSSAVDAMSILANPFFTSFATEDYTPQSMVIDGFAADYTSIAATDINGAPRVHPSDPGAIEFTGVACTGFSGITDTVTSNSATVMWNGPGQQADIIWGPVGFLQASAASDTVHVNANDTSATIVGMNSNTCYDYYIQIFCTSSVSGAPALMGPYTVCTNCAGGGLSGTYTVGGSAGSNNFATLDSVVKTLNGCGITGPVVFNMQGGRHSAVELGYIDGVSATNTITFNGAPNYGDSIIGSNASAAVTLFGAEHISFNGIYMTNGGFVTWMYLGSNHISFDSCIMVGDTTTTSSTRGVVVASNSSTSTTAAGDNVSHLSISNSKIIGGYYGAIIYGASSTSKNAGIEFINNEFSKQYYYGLRTYFTDSVLIQGNSVKDMRNTSTGYAYYFYYTDNLSVLGNEAYGAENTAMLINNSNTVNPLPGARTLVANNMLQSEGAYGLNVNTCSYIDFFHNSVSAAGNYGFYLSGSSATDVDIRNNIIENSGTGTALYIASTPANTFVDYNLYFASGNVGNNQSDLTTWQTAEPLWNQNSIESSLSNFVSSTDFHALGNAADDLGDNTAGITIDFDGEPRPASGSTTVDMGADEFTPLNFDMKAELIIDPVNGACGDSNTSVSVIITNLGLQSASNIGVTVNITGATTATMAGVYSGTIPTLESDTLTISSFNSVVGGIMNLEAIVNFTGDQDASNDTVRTSVNLKDGLARVPVAQLDTVCTGMYDTLYWPANSSDLLLQWETTNGDSLSVNDTLVVGPLASNDTTFVLAQRVFPTGSVGAADNTFGNFGTSWGTTHGLYFDVYAATTLYSVDVYPTGNGVIEFVLEDANNNIIDTRIVAITGGSTTVPFTAKLGFNLTPGTDYLLRPGTGSTTTCIRNFTGASYPYTLPGVLSITGNVFNNGPGTYYYYFYNWQLGGGCPRPDGSVTIYNGGGAITPAFTETLQNPTQTNMVVDFDASSSVGASSYSWDFGDGNTGSGMTTNHSYNTNGTYTVTLVITGTCGTDSISKTITVSGIGLEENALSRSMNVYPNPAHTVLNIQFETLNQNAVIRITDVAGKEVMRFDETNINKYFSKTVDISKLSNGIYMLEISDDNLSAVRRLIKE